MECSTTLPTSGDTSSRVKGTDDVRHGSAEFYQKTGGGNRLVGNGYRLHSEFRWFDRLLSKAGHFLAPRLAGNQPVRADADGDRVIPVLLKRSDRQAVPCRAVDFGAPFV